MPARPWHHGRGVGGDAGWSDGRIERVGLCAPRDHDRIEILERAARGSCVVRREAEPDLRALTGAHREPIMRRDLGAGLGGIHGIRPPVHDVVVDRILDPGRAVRGPEQALGVGLVVGEE
jgi:hypothetical protein